MKHHHTLRRSLIGALAAAPLVNALPLRAQTPSPAMPHVTLVLTGSLRTQADRVEPLRQRLRELGYIEDKNLILDIRELDGRFERLPALMQEVVAARPQIIVLSGSQSVRAALAATSTIPIVTITVARPVEQGFAVSLARPGKNVTGNVLIEGVTGEKSVEIIHEFVPRGTRIAFLDDPANPVDGRTQRFGAAAARLKLTPIFVAASSLEEVPPAFASAVKQRAQMLVVASSAVFSANPKITVNLAARHRLPAVYPNDAYVADGALVTYGYSNAVMARNAALIADRILKGRKPAELPFEQPTHFEMVVNRTTAKTLGLTIPQTILVRADRVIE